MLPGLKLVNSVTLSGSKLCRVLVWPRGSCSFTLHRSTSETAPATACSDSLTSLFSSNSITSWSFLARWKACFYSLFFLIKLARTDEQCSNTYKKRTKLPSRLRRFQNLLSPKKLVLSLQAQASVTLALHCSLLCGFRISL